MTEWEYLSFLRNMSDPTEWHFDFDAGRHSRPKHGWERRTAHFEFYACHKGGERVLLERGATRDDVRIKEEKLIKKYSAWTIKYSKKCS